MVVELVVGPLPRPSDSAYVNTRLLEALGEARLALKYLKRGLICNAVCKAFQAGKAFMTALLRLELDKLRPWQRQKRGGLRPFLGCRRIRWSGLSVC